MSLYLRKAVISVEETSFSDSTLKTMTARSKGDLKGSKYDVDGSKFDVEGIKGNVDGVKAKKVSEFGARKKEFDVMIAELR